MTIPAWLGMLHRPQEQPIRYNYPLFLRQELRGKTCRKNLPVRQKVLNLLPFLAETITHIMRGSGSLRNRLTPTDYSLIWTCTSDAVASDVLMSFLLACQSFRILACLMVDLGEYADPANKKLVREPCRRIMAQHYQNASA